jgi:hypothetical protein
MKNTILWDDTLRRFCKNQRFGGTYRNVPRLLVIASAVPSSQILLTLMMEVLRSSETSVLIRAMRGNIPEYSIFHTGTRLPATILHYSRQKFQNFLSYQI